MRKCIEIPYRSAYIPPGGMTESTLRSFSSAGEELISSLTASNVSLRKGRVRGGNRSNIYLGAAEFRHDGTDFGGGNML